MFLDSSNKHNREPEHMRYSMNRRCGSVQRSRNPITEGEDPPNMFKYKAKVPTYLTETKKHCERPRGIGQGYFSTRYQGNFNIGKDPVVDYRPLKKRVVDENKPEKSKSSKRILQSPAPNRNPILQDSSFEVPVHFSRKMGYPDTPSGQNAEVKYPVTPSRQNSYLKRNSSNLFRDENRDRSFDSQRRSFYKNDSSLASIMQYKFALPYRDTKVTDKVV